jgi:hypothetical protein
VHVDDDVDVLGVEVGQDRVGAVQELPDTGLVLVEVAQATKRIGAKVTCPLPSSTSTWRVTLRPYHRLGASKRRLPAFSSNRGNDVCC